MILPILITLAFVMFCVYMVQHAMQAYQKAKESYGWPTTEGVLVDVHLWGTRNIGGKMVAAENLSVSYEYQVDGNKYSGNVVSFYRMHYPETTDFTEAHPQNSQTRVYYNPEDHQDAVLIPGLHPTKPYGGLVLAVLAVVVSIGVAVAVWLGVF